MSGIHRRLPLDAVTPYLRARLADHYDRQAGLPVVIADLAGTTKRSAHRWILAGTIPEQWAERIADSLGEHPGMIWGDEWWNLAARGVPTSDEGYERALAAM